MTTANSRFFEKALLGQKDFQRATTERVYQRMFGQQGGTRRMLIADEVGLGKTIVARGVIARRLQDLARERQEGGGRKKTFRVTYICSNQIIAADNIRKLDIYPDEASHERFASRIAFLAFAPQETKRALKLNSLTPGTSFVTTNNPFGQQDERKIIYLLLTRDEALARQKDGIALLLRGGVTRDEQEWINELGRLDWTLREDLFPKFLEFIKHEKSPDGTSLYEAVLKHSARLNNISHEFWREESKQLAGQLRLGLIDLCVEYIDADLYILDEFQRFSDLINSEKDTEAARIAHRVFSKEKARVLLLSATPFKALTTTRDQDVGEDHYQEFRVVLKFLFDNDEAKIQRYERARAALFRQLHTLGGEATDLDPRHRDEAQQILREVICRTERFNAIRPGEIPEMDEAGQGQQAAVTRNDINNFLWADRVALAVNSSLSARERQLPAPLEFCKSTPYPLSFLDGYAFKDKLRRVKHSREVREVLRQTPGAWIDFSRVDSFTLQVGKGAGDANARLAQVVDEAFDGRAERMLWVPPSLPYYPLKGAFKQSGGYSKLLVFSAWLMVPRMLSMLLSYEAERRTLGKLAEAARANKKRSKKKKRQKRAPGEGESEVRYFREDKTSQPLKFSESKGKPSGMNLFNLIYPSVTLAEELDLVRSHQEEQSLEQIQARLEERFAILCQGLGGQGEVDKNWYWAAPLILDHGRHPEVKAWFAAYGVPTFMRRKDEANRGAGRRRHAEKLRGTFWEPGELRNKRPPADLASVLAATALGSPAVLMLRSLRRSGCELEQAALLSARVGEAFVTLFNKPESGVVVKQNDPRRQAYWRRVLTYCTHGCLQAVLDEYLHLLLGEMKTIDDAVDRFVETVNITTSTPNIDDSEGFLSGNPRTMRCHFALELGNQRIETDQGQKRVASIRRNFNSPFRPFVLATTSIGQEGLDFHQYCRKVVHWNLPSNPIDVEQREGRINRFKGLFIRQTIGDQYGTLLLREDLKDKDVWEALFDIAHTMEKGDRCELVPYWHVRCDKYPIKRIIPLYPYSRDQVRLKDLLRTLALYRLTFGQPNQSELIEHLLEHAPEDMQEVTDKLLINLAPQIEAD